MAHRLSPSLACRSNCLPHRTNSNLLEVFLISSEKIARELDESVKLPRSNMHLVAQLVGTSVVPSSLANTPKTCIFLVAITSVESSLSVELVALPCAFPPAQLRAHWESRLYSGQSVPP